MSGVQARNPLVDGWNRHGDEAFNGDTGRAGHNDGVCADSPMSETSARGHCGAGIENDFPATGLADEEGLRAAHPRYPVARAAAGSNVRVFGVQPDDGNELLVQSPVDSTETKEV